MRFETRFDQGLVSLMALAAVASCVAPPVLRFLAPGPNPGPPWLAFTPWGIWLIVLPCMLPQYYEVRETGLFLRQGWRKSLIPYSSLVELQPRSDSMSAAVFSTDRILVVTAEGKRFLIAVAEDERFLAEVAKRSPQLDRRNFGLGMPLAPPSTY
jgi:Bacterial PH domain